MATFFKRGINYFGIDHETWRRPLCLALLAFPFQIETSVAAELGQIVVDDPSGTTQIMLNASDTVTYDGPGAAIIIKGSGNEVRGSSISVAAGSAIDPTASSTVGVQVSQGGSATLLDSNVATSGHIASGLEIRDSGSSITLKNTNVRSESGDAVSVFDGGAFDMEGGVLSTTNVDGVGGIIPYAGVKAGLRASISMKNARIESSSYGIHAATEQWQMQLDGVTIDALGAQGVGIDVSDFTFGAPPDSFSHFTANNLTINAQSGGLAVAGASTVARLQDAAIDLFGIGGHGVTVAQGANFLATRLHLRTYGESSQAVLVFGAVAEFNDALIETFGNDSIGILNTAGKLILNSSTVVAQGEGGAGIAFAQTTETVLNNSHIVVEGRGDGAWTQAGGLGPGGPTSLILANGSSISTQDGAAFRMDGSNSRVRLENSAVIGRNAGSDSTGILLHSLDLVVPGLVIPAGETTLIAEHSVLVGDVLMESGQADVSLESGSVLTGALVQRGTGRVNSLTLDSASAWNVRGDSSLGTLTNAGVVAFTAPAGAGSFKTLTVNDYIGGGTLVLNTSLGDDASPTDKLVIDGGAASGNTGLRIVNAGGNGGQTALGVRVVQTVNGGTTATDAFHLDSGSTGYRASADTVSLNGYDYSLVRGGNGGVAPDWYLTSVYNPAPPLDPVNPVDPALPAGGFKNVSPESGAYAGNRLAAVRLFSHGLHDRVPAYADGDVGARQGRGLWARTQGRHDSGLRMTEGRVDVDTDSAMLQLGGDLLKAPLGREGAVYAGLMGGYGDARSRSVSTLLQPGRGQRLHVRARGKVSGYSAGVYGTVYQNDATRLGGYADTWVQYGRYTNQINSELGSVSYRSDVWSASLEAGYALKPFAADSALQALVVEPNVQLIYNRYDAQGATLQGTRMSSANNGAWQSRVGVRFYPQAAPAAAGKPAVRPFLETNWLHDTANPAVRMGNAKLQAQPARNAFELKVGAQGRVGKATQLSGHVFGQAGNGSQRAYGGMVNVSYRW